MGVPADAATSQPRSRAVFGRLSSHPRNRGGGGRLGCLLVGCGSCGRVGVGWSGCLSACRGLWCGSCGRVAAGRGRCRFARGPLRHRLRDVRAALGWHRRRDSRATRRSERAGCAAEDEHADEGERASARHAPKARRPTDPRTRRDIGALVVTLRCVDHGAPQLGQVVHGVSLSRSRRFRRPRLTRWRATLGEHDNVRARSA